MPPAISIFGQDAAAAAVACQQSTWWAVGERQRQGAAQLVAGYSFGHGLAFAIRWLLLKTFNISTWAQTEGRRVMRALALAH